MKYRSPEQECWPASGRDWLTAHCGIRFGRLDRLAPFRKSRRSIVSVVGREHASARYRTAYGFDILLPAWDANVIIAASNGRILHPRLTEIFLALIQPGDVFVDGGANVGFYSLLAARALEGRGCVISFEPDPRNLPILHSNLQINNLNALARVVPKALSNNEGDLDFWGAQDNSWGGSVVGLPSANGRQLKVPATTLDSYAAATNLEGVDIIKLDIEGAEPLALEGMRTTLRTSKLLVYEINKPRLDQLGIRPQSLIQQAMEWGQFVLTLLTDERTDEVLPLESPRSAEILEVYGWANVVSAKGDAARRLHEVFGYA